ncbi:MAG: type II toxin-antitoxin system RelE/ParE family toxin [Variovorax sp.]|nr:type II toxin-antitoxin system RelE/ParE family toxin [Variovorax sp.]
MADLYHYIAASASPDIASRFAEAIVAYCESLRTFPHRGTQRDDFRPGLRVTRYKHRTVIACDVVAEQVSIIGIFYGGQDYESALHDDSEDT